MLRTRTLLLASCIAAAPALALAQNAAPQSSPRMQNNQQMTQHQDAQRGAHMKREFLAAPRAGQMRAEHLRSAAIYTADDQRVGDIDDLLLDANGDIVAVVVGVGGFLGIGEKDVAIPFESLELRNPAMANASNMGGARMNETATGRTAAERPMTTGAVPGGTTRATDQDRQRMTAQRAENMAEDKPRTATTERAPNATTSMQRTAQATQGLWKPERIFLRGVTKADLEGAPEFKWNAVANDAAAPARNR